MPRVALAPPAASPGGPAFYSIDDIAGSLRVSAKHVRRLLAQQKLPAPARIGRRVRWHAPTFDAWLAAGCPAQAAPSTTTAKESARAD